MKKSQESGVRSQESGDRSRKPEVRSRETAVRNQKLTRLGVIFILLGLVLFSCNSGTKKTAPIQQSEKSGVAKFVVSEEIHNFGSLKAGEIVSFTFIFRNDGTETLTITGVDSGCGCTEVKIPDKTIQPGQEGRIEVIYDSAGEVGKQLKTITITSNAEPSKKQLFIRANVKNEVIEIYS
jgi:hypothetical protein